MCFGITFRQQLIAGNDFLHHLEAHPGTFTPSRFQLFNLGEGQFVIGIFTPVRLAVHGVKVETVFGGFFAPVREKQTILTRSIISRP